METFFNPQEDLPKDPDSIANIVNPEDKEARRKHREEMAQEIVEKYGTDGEKGLRQTLEELYPDQSWEEIQDRIKNIGISFDEQGRLRLKRPGAGEDVPGQFEKEEVIQGIVEGWANARTFKDQWDVISYTYKYLNLVPPEMPEEVEVEKEGGLRPWLRKNVKNMKVAALLALALLPNVHGKNGVNAAEMNPVDDTDTKIEDVQGEESQEAAPYEIVSENLHVLQKGEDLTQPLAAKLLRDAGVAVPTEAELNKVAGSLAESNNVAVPEWGIEGEVDHRELPVGFEVDLRDGRSMAAEIATSR